MKLSYITYRYGLVSRDEAAAIIRRMRADAVRAGVPYSVKRSAWARDLPATVIRTTCSGGVRGMHDSIIIE